jgi:micrococcal nuclease
VGILALLIGGALVPGPEIPDRPAPRASESATPDGFTVSLAPSPSPSLSPTRPAGIPPEAQEAQVVRHVDGDTLWLEGGTLPPNAASSVRLLEIDAPEVGTPYADAATNFLRQELPIGATVYVLADEDNVDSFGRFLRYVWKSNGEFFNEKAVRLGYARTLLIPPNDAYISVIRAAEQEARAARRGIWAVTPTSAQTATTTRPQTAPLPTPASGPRDAASGCDPSYPDFCIAPPPPDLDCADIGRSLSVLQPDPHRFDGQPGQAGEPDGIGCESYN